MRPVPTFTFSILLLLSGLAVPALVSAADTNAPAPKSTLPPKRFLLIVETSKPMQKRAENVYRAVQELLLSKMDEQLRSGDTIGLWTYNDELHAGQFPLQQWTPETHGAISARIMSHLKEQPCEKQPSLVNALAALQRVVNSSACLTIIIFSDGAQPIQGTPFDEQINGTFKLWQKEQQKARMPFITALRGIKGKLTDYTVTGAPWPVELPDLPPEPKVVAAAKPAPKEQKPAPTVAPLIISGKKPQPAPAPATPEPAAKTNETVVTQSPQPPKPESPLPTTAEAPAALTTGPTQISGAPNAPPTSQSSAQGFTPPTPANASPEPIPSPSLSVPPSATAPSLGESKPKSGADDPAASAPENNSIGQTAPATIRPESVPSTLDQSAVAVTPQPFLNQKNIIIAALVLAGIVLVLGLITLLKPRQASSQTSFITRSLDRENKL